MTVNIPSGRRVNWSNFAHSHPTDPHLKLHGGMLAQAGVFQYGWTFFALFDIEEASWSLFDNINQHHDQSQPTKDQREYYDGKEFPPWFPSRHDEQLWVAPGMRKVVKMKASSQSPYYLL